LTIKVTHVTLLTALFYGGESLNRNTATRYQRKQEKEELRQTILKAAGALFLEQGYDRFSMSRLAQEIGYSDATLYLYFRNKDDLLFTVVDKAFSKG
jgi:AcrR family transcriptional regulator